MILLILFLYQENLDAELPMTVWVEPDIKLGSFNAHDIAIPDLLRRINSEREINLVADPAIKERLTLQLHDTTLNELINLITELYPIRCRRVGNVLRLEPMPPPEPPAPPEPVNEMTWDGDSGTISFELEAINATLFAQEITRMTGQNLLPQGAVKDHSIKGFLASLPLKRALELILRQNNLELIDEGDVFFIRLPGKAVSETSANETGEAIPLSGVRSVDGLYDVHYENEKIAVILSEISALGQTPIVIRDQPELTISLDLRGVDAEVLLNILLDGTDFGYIEQNGVYTVGKKSGGALRANQVVTLNHLNAEMVEQMLPTSIREGVTLSIIKEHNSLLLNGSMDETRALAKLIEEIDKPVAQVLIEVLVVDYNFNNDRKLGVELSNGDNTIFPGLDLTLEGFRDASGSFQVRRLPSNFPLRIRALETRGVAKIISKPHVAALNGHEASIKIGAKQFYRIETEELVGNENPRVRTSQEIREIEANIALKITPWVSGAGEVTTLIEPTFTSFLGQVDDNIPPPISTRELSSTIRLKDGETIILGGLIQNFDTVNYNGLPFISKVPILGGLFRNQDKNRQQSELIIYITPHVYYGDEGSVAFIREGEGMEYQLDVERQQLGRKGDEPPGDNWYQSWKRKRKERREKRRQEKTEEIQ